MNCRIASAAVVLVSQAIALWLPPACVRASEFEVPLTVEEPAGVDRVSEPASGGIPLPPGRFKRDQSFALFDHAGKEVPTQVLPLVVDEKGFLRWVLVDLQADFRPNARASCTLKAAEPARSGGPAEGQLRTDRCAGRRQVLRNGQFRRLAQPQPAE